MSEVKTALIKAKVKVADAKRTMIDGRRAAAIEFWKKIKTQGKKDYDEAIKNCSTEKCPNAVLKKGPQYEKTPVNKGNWRDGDRGDGNWVPSKDSDAGKALQEFNAKQNPPTNFDHIPYKDGFPNYDNFVLKMPDGNPARVEIAQQGGYKDYIPANKAMKEKYPEWKGTPDGYTWHHSPDGVTMELVPSNLHGGHKGGTYLQKQSDF